MDRFIHAGGLLSLVSLLGEATISHLASVCKPDLPFVKSLCFVLRQQKLIRDPVLQKTPRVELPASIRHRAAFHRTMSYHWTIEPRAHVFIRFATLNPKPVQVPPFCGPSSRHPSVSAAVANFGLQASFRDYATRATGAQTSTKP